MENIINLSVEALQIENQFLQSEVLVLKEQLAWFKRQTFGKRSEKIVSKVSAQQLEFDGFETLVKEEPASQTIPAHQRKKQSRKGQDTIKLPEDLPVETTILDLPEEEKMCKETGKPLVKIGEETSYKLAHRPGTYYLKEIIRPKYAHPKQEERGVDLATFFWTVRTRFF